MATNASLRKLLVFAESRIDEAPDRYRAIDRANSVRDRFNAYADENARVVFLMPPKSGRAIPAAEVEVLPFDDGLYSYSVSVDLPESGMSTPFGTGAWERDLYPTLRKAAKAGVGSALKYVLGEQRRADNKIKKSECQRLVAAMREFLNGKEQSALF